MPETVHGFHYLRMVRSKKITLKLYVQHVHTLAAKRSHRCEVDSGWLGSARWFPTPVWRQIDVTVVDCCT